MPIAREKSNTRTGDRSSDAKNITIEDYLRQREQFKRLSPVTTGAKERVRNGNIFASKSRGYIKLSNAAKAFNFDFRGKTVLDIGSSTGGFTEYALEKGAKKVIAIEKGTNQMKSPLRNDPRINLHEKTDIFDIEAQIALFFGARPAGPSPRAAGAKSRAAALRIPSKQTLCAPDIILADVSFVSLKKVLLHAKNHLAGNHTEFLVMLKPQFEAKPNELVRGIVKNDSLRRKIIKDFEQWLKQNNFKVIKKHDNFLKGKTGNKERFYYLKLAK